MQKPSFFQEPLSPKMVGRPVEFLLAGQAGERFVAKIRLVMALLFLFFVVKLKLDWPTEPRIWVGFLFASSSAASAALIYLAARRSLFPTYLSFISSILDVSLVTIALFILEIYVSPHLAINNPVLYPWYFLMLMATSLRYDVWVCWVTGGMAALQYAFVVYYAQAHWDLNDPAFAPFRYGMYYRPEQGARIVLLLLATLLAALITHRARYLLYVSTRDGLTGLLNRSFFDERLRQEFAGIPRGNRFSLALLDLDYFKDINDTYGHQVGDAVLRAVGHVLRTSFRLTDTVARYGGEEFAILLSGKDDETIQTRIQEIRKKLAWLTVPIHDNQVMQIEIGFSAGLATSREASSTPEMLLGLADARLYKAKRRGRNQTVGPFEGEVDPD